MPTYSILSDEIVSSWLDTLNTMSVHLEQNPSMEGIAMFAVALYEYLQISIGFRVKFNNEDAYGVKLSFEDVKKDAIDDEMRSNFRTLKLTADKLRHEYYNSHDIVLDLLDKLITNSTNMSSIWHFYLPKGSKIQTFLLNSNLLSGIRYALFNEKELIEKVKNFVIDYLEVNGKSGIASKHTVGEAVSAVCSKFNCSRYWASDIVCTVLVNHRCI